MYESTKHNYEIYPEHMKMLAGLVSEMGYEVDWIDSWSGFLFKANGSYFGYGHLPKFPLDKAISRMMCKDKAYSYILMEKNNITVPEGDYFIRDEGKGESDHSYGKGIKEALRYADTIGYPLFVKPNSMSRGKHCRVIFDRYDLMMHLNDIFAEDRVALIQKIVEGKEYRLVVLDGEIILCYEKIPPKVTGDGKRSLHYLIEDVKNSGIEDFEVDWGMLAKKNIGEGTILSEGQVLSLRDNANLNSGGWVVDMPEDFSDSLKKYVRKIAEIFKLRLYGLDLKATDLADSDSFVVIEINSDPGFEAFMKYNRQKTTEVMQKILQKCF